MYTYEVSITLNGECSRPTLEKMNVTIRAVILLVSTGDRETRLGRCLFDIFGISVCGVMETIISSKESINNVKHIACMQNGTCKNNGNVHK